MKFFVCLSDKNNDTTNSDGSNSDSINSDSSKGSNPEKKNCFLLDIV